jgi:hypothetical protein
LIYIKSPHPLKGSLETFFHYEKCFDEIIFFKELIKKLLSPDLSSPPVGGDRGL